jgi:hypothetical protein
MEKKTNHEDHLSPQKQFNERRENDGSNDELASHYYKILSPEIINLINVYFKPRPYRSELETEEGLFFYIQSLIQIIENHERETMLDDKLSTKERREELNKLYGHKEQLHEWWRSMEGVKSKKLDSSFSHLSIPEQLVSTTGSTFHEYEEFIRGTKITLNGDIVQIRFSGKRQGTPYSKEKLGFQKSPKSWDDFIAILGGGFIAIPIVPKNRHINRSEYDKHRARLRTISKKLVSFFNKECTLEIPDNYFLFDSVSEGKYRPKFSTDDRLLKELYKEAAEEEPPSFGESPYGHTSTYEEN